MDARRSARALFAKNWEGGAYMRRYSLVSSTARSDVDLRDYAEVITEAVHSVMPKAKVRVLQDCYYVSPSPDQSQAVKIGRIICQSKLRKYCVMVPKLFISYEMQEE